MSSQEPPSGSSNPAKPDGAPASESTPLLNDTDATMEDSTTEQQPPEETWEDIPDDVKNAASDEIQTRTRLIDNDIRVRTGRVKTPTYRVSARRLTSPVSGNAFRDATIIARTSDDAGEDSR